MAESHRMVNPQKIYVKDLNTCLTCTLCGGYFIDATTVVDCSHTFCRACIVRHFESSRLCPSCGSLVHKSKPLSKLRSDTSLQSLVYKVIPSLYSKELQRRADFYHSTSFRANSSCSDDSVLGDRTQDSADWAASNIGDPSLYFSPDDSISLSVEYYTKEALESCEPKTEISTDSNSDTLTNSNNNNNDIDSVKTEVLKNGDIASEANTNSKETMSEIKEKSVVVSHDMKIEEEESSVFMSGLTHKRYLQCPAAVRMSHLMKFLRMKFGLSNEHRVDIIYAGEVLPPYLSLMDVAYTFKWDREKPMRFFYLIYIPVLRQVVTQQPSAITSPPTTPSTEQPPIPPLKIEISNNKIDLKDNIGSPTDIKSIKKHKEIIIKEPTKPEMVDDKKEDNNNLKISPKVKDKTEKLQNDAKSSQKTVKFVDNYSSKSHHVEYKIKTNDSDNCVFEYSEPDKDEIKAFAERRDREWALQKYPEVHVSRKRKKNKHSKNEFMHKKRKLHAEITSNEVLSNTDDSLKLKVKLSVANGHKHKHRSSSNNSVTIVEPIKTQELSPKERLLQMRQVRRPVSAPAEDKPKNQESTLKMVITTEKVSEKFKLESSKTLEKAESSQKVEKTPDVFSTGKTLRSDFSNKTSLSKDLCNKYVRVSLEKFADKNSLPKKIPSNNILMTKTSDKEEIKLRNLDANTEIIPIENKPDNSKVSNNTNCKIVDSGLSIKLADKTNSSKILDNKFNANNKTLDNKLIVKQNDVNSLTITENKTVEQKLDSKTIEHRVNKPLESKVNLKPVENKIPHKTIDTKSNKTIEQTKMASQDPKLLSPKAVTKNDRKSPIIDESKIIENKLNNIDFKTSQSSTFVTKNFTVSKVETGAKRKLESPEITSDKVPSLEITVINMVSRPPQTSSNQTNPIQTKTNSVPSKLVCSTQTKPTVSSEGSPAKKIRPPPLTIPLGRIQKMNNINKMQKPAEKCDIFGALDLSAKPMNKTEIKTNEFRAHSASPKIKIQDQIQSLIRPKTPIKTGDIKNDSAKLQKPNISNLQMLSESAVQIRELMTKGSPISGIPNLIKKIPTPITQNSAQKNADFLQKSSNFQQKASNSIPKTPQSIVKSINNFSGKPPSFLSKNLQKLPKLNEISKGQFCRLNTGQVRPARPAGQNQTVRNIPNPSLLVRQQNQNRINALSNSNPVNNEIQKQDTATKPKIENSETEKRSENKTSEPPPLKPIELFKK